MYVIGRLERSRLMKDARIFSVKTYFDLHTDKPNHVSLGYDYLMRLDYDFKPVPIYSLKPEHFEGPLKEYINHPLIRYQVDGRGFGSYLTQTTTKWLKKQWENK